MGDEGANKVNILAREADLGRDLRSVGDGFATGQSRKVDASNTEIAMNLPPPSRFTDRLGDAIRMGDRLDLIKRGLWRFFILMIYSGILTCFLFFVTLLLANIYGVDIIDWNQSSPGITLQDTLTLEDGKASILSSAIVPLQVTGSHDETMKLNVAGTSTAEVLINMGYQDDKDYITRSYLRSDTTGNLALNTQRHLSLTSTSGEVSVTLSKLQWAATRLVVQECLQVNGTTALGNSTSHNVVASGDMLVKNGKITARDLNVTGSIDLSRAEIFVDQTLPAGEIENLQIANLRLKVLNYESYSINLANESTIAGAHFGEEGYVSVTGGVSVTNGGLKVLEGRPH